MRKIVSFEVLILLVVFLIDATGRLLALLHKDAPNEEAWNSVYWVCNEFAFGLLFMFLSLVIPRAKGLCTYFGLCFWTAISEELYGRPWIFDYDRYLFAGVLALIIFLIFKINWVAKLLNKPLNRLKDALNRRQ